MPLNLLKIILRHSLKGGLLSVFLVFLFFPAKGQNDAQFSQYWALPALYNPAAAGSTDMLRIRGGGKLQWLGIENAPQSFVATADSPFRIGGKQIGAGAQFSTEKLGLFSNLLAAAQLSYSFKLGKGLLTIGVQPGYYSSRFRGTDIYVPDGDYFHQPGDEALPTQDLSGEAFDISAGLRYSHKNFSLGISALHITSPTIGLSLADTEASESHEFETKQPMGIYFTADGNIPIKNTLFVLQPSMMVHTDLSSFTADVTLRSTFNRFLTFGLSYRYNSAVSAMIGAEFKNFFLGYAYDLPTNAIAKASSGSHEVVLGYSLKLNFTGKNKHSHRSIRLM